MSNNDFRDAVYETRLSNDLRGFTWWKQIVGMFLYGMLNGIINRKG